MQEQYNEKRKQYMANEISHDEFYLWLADSIHVSVNDLPFSLDQVRNSKDAHLNDLPLPRWDRQDSIVRHKAVRAGMRAWSLCDTVCVLKTFAKRESAE